MRFVVTLGALVVAFGAPLGAQAPQGATSSQALWASAGVGPGTEAAAVLVSLRYSRGGHLLSARTAGSFGISEGEGRTDFGLLYGRRVRWHTLYAHASAGAAFVVHEEADVETSGGLGIPLSVGVGWAPVPFVGLGLEAFGDVNPTEHFGGIVLTVELGLIR